MNYKYDAVETGKRIRAIRKQNKFTQEQLAEELYLTAESVSNFENGKTMCMPENIAKICELFGVTSDYIYYGIESASKVKNPLMDSIMAKLSGCSADELDRIDKMISLFDNDTEALLTTARKHLCQFAVLKYQQMDGLNTAMPFGTRKIDAFRTLTTESIAVFIPFRVQDIYHENGIYYGQNVISKNMIIADRRQLLNGNSFILGVSGGGKSFAAKGEIENIILSSNADVIIIDPEREYSQLVKALGGEIINISATSPSHINAMDMNKEYGDGANPVILKSEFIMSLCEQLIGGTNLGAKQKSIIDRCTASVYRDYQQRGYTGTVPTLQDFRAELLKQDEPEAKEIALAIELFTHGSLNTFAKPTNVDTDNRLICYDILDLGKQLMPIGMLVVLDSILNRITQNRAK